MKKCLAIGSMLVALSYLLANYGMVALSDRSTALAQDSTPPPSTDVAKEETKKDELPPDPPAASKPSEEEKLPGPPAKRVTRSGIVLPPRSTIVKKVSDGTAVPTVSINAPLSVDIPHMVNVEIEVSGSKVRETDVRISPTPADGDFFQIGTPGMPGWKVVFVGPPGVYTIEVLAIGEERGFCREEARVRVRDSRPPIPSELAGPQKPEVLLKRWADQVASSNLAAEMVQIAAAAHVAAEEVRSKAVMPHKSIDEWQAQAYTKMGKAMKPWNDSSNGKSFFDYVRDLRDDASRATADFDDAKFLDSLGTILEGGR